MNSDCVWYVWMCSYVYLDFMTCGVFVKLHRGEWLPLYVFTLGLCMAA